MSSKKVLVLYYRGSGNTKKMAKAIDEGMRSSALKITGEDVGKFLTSPDSYYTLFNS